MHTAPELLLGEPLGPKADVYSFAMLLYRLAAGEAPTLPTSDEAQRSGSSSAGAGSSNMGWAAAAALIDVCLRFLLTALLVRPRVTSFHC